MLKSPTTRPKMMTVEGDVAVAIKMVRFKKSVSFSHVRVKGEGIL